MSVLLSRQYDKEELNRGAVDWYTALLQESTRLKTITPSKSCHFVLSVLQAFFCAQKQGLQRYIRYFFSMLFPLLTFTWGLMQTLDHYDFQWLMLSNTKLNRLPNHSPGNTGGYPQEFRLGSGKHPSHCFFWWPEQFGLSCFLFLTTKVLFPVKLKKYTW